MGANFHLFRADPCSEGACCTGKQQGGQSFLLLETWQKYPPFIES